MGADSCCRGERKLILMDPVLADIYLTQQLKASPRRKKGTMSRKERRDAINALLEMVRRHEAEWTTEQLITNFSLRHGYTRKTAEGYLGELVIAGLVTVRENSVYTIERKPGGKGAPEK